MPHPFFDANEYPWSRDDAKVLWRQLRTLITNVSDIKGIYLRSGGELGDLHLNAAPDEVWQNAIEKLASARKLEAFIGELETFPLLKGNADFHAALRAVRDAEPTPPPAPSGGLEDGSVADRARSSPSASPVADPLPAPGPVALPSGSGRVLRRWPMVAGVVIGVLIVLFVGSLVAQGLFKVDVPWLPGTGQAPTVRSIGEPSAQETAPSETPTVGPIPRLQNGPRATDAAGVVTTIERIDQLGEVTELELTVQNNLPHTISLFKSRAALVAADGTTVTADPFAGTWAEEIPSGLLLRGTIILDGVLPPEATTATFSFPTVFRQGLEGPDSISVTDLAIAGVSE